MPVQSLHGLPEWVRGQLGQLGKALSQKSKEGYSSNSWQSICLPYTKSYIHPLKMKADAMRFSQDHCGRAARGRLKQLRQEVVQEVVGCLSWV